MNGEIVYIVQYHSNAWGDQESSDDILGVYESEEEADKRADEFEEKYAWDDDIVSVYAYTIGEKVSGGREAFEESFEEER